MGWNNAVLLTPPPSPPAAISVGINGCKKGNPRLTVNFNKAMANKLGLNIGTRADIEVGDGEHLGLARIVFNIPGGACRVISGGGLGGTSQGCRVSSRIWPGLKPSASRVKLKSSDFQWNAESSTIIINIPPSLLIKPVYQSEIKLVCAQRKSSLTIEQP
jgi:hypothetical protein